MKKYLISLCALAFMAAACSGSDADVEKLTIGPEKVNCTGVVPQKCLKIKRAGSDDWELWYSGIEGFDHQDGYEYEVKIRKVKVENPPADASSVKYVLEKVVSSKKVAE